MPRRQKPVTADEAFIALRVYPELMGIAALAKDYFKKRDKLQRIEQEHLEQGKRTRCYESAQIEEATAARVLQQALTLIPLPEMPYP